jgi:hypothetical protein
VRSGLAGRGRRSRGSRVRQRGRLQHRAGTLVSAVRRPGAGLLGDPRPAATRKRFACLAARVVERRAILSCIPLRRGEPPRPGGERDRRPACRAFGAWLRSQVARLGVEPPRRGWRRCARRTPTRRRRARASRVVRDPAVKRVGSRARWGADLSEAARCGRAGGRRRRRASAIRRRSGVRVAPRPGFGHPLARNQAAVQEQAGVVVKGGRRRGWSGQDASWCAYGLPDRGYSPAVPGPHRSSRS